MPKRLKKAERLCDELLSGGASDFQIKCAEAIKSMIAREAKLREVIEIQREALKFYSGIGDKDKVIEWGPHVCDSYSVRILGELTRPIGMVTCKMSRKKSQSKP